VQQSCHPGQLTGDEGTEGRVADVLGDHPVEVVPEVRGPGCEEPEVDVS
jgi:hypothetical protein